MQKDLSALQQQQQFNFCRQVNSNAERTLRENLMINGKNQGKQSKAMQLSLNDNIVQSNAYGKLRKRSIE